MAEITIAKAKPTGDKPTPDTHIHITGELPDIPYDGSTPLGPYLAAMAAHYDEQARQLEEVLIRTLPGGTYDRLLGRMLARKASHFRVAHEAGG